MHDRRNRLLFRLPDADREAASVETGLEIEDPEHFHAVARDREFLGYNRNLPEAERLDEGIHDLVMRNRELSCCCRRCW